MFVAVALVIITAIAALGLWGTRWTIPRAPSTIAHYTLKATWDGEAATAGPLVMLTADGEFVTDRQLPSPDSKVYSPEHVAVSADGSTVYATDFAGNRVLVLAVTPPR